MFPEEQYGEISVVYLFTKGICKAMCVFVGPDFVRDNVVGSISTKEAAVSDQSDGETDPTVIATCII